MGSVALLLPFLGRMVPTTRAAHLLGEDDIITLKFQAAHVGAQSNNPGVLKAIIALGEADSADVRRCQQILAKRA